MLKALVERRYIDSNRIRTAKIKFGDVFVTDCRDIKLIGIALKRDINDKLLKSDVTKCLVIKKIHTWSKH